MNHIRHFIKIPFINKGIDFIDLPSIFKDNTVEWSSLYYFENKEPPIICYKYNKPIRSTIFNFDKLVANLDIDTKTPDSSDCKNSKFCYEPAGHIITGNLKIISDSTIRSIISKGPKYRLPSQIDFNKCKEEMAVALNEFCKRWCRREHVECNALNSWKISIFNIIEKRISFYSKNHNLLPPKPKLSFRHLKQGIQQFNEKFVLAPADKASNNDIVV